MPANRTFGFSVSGLIRGSRRIHGAWIDAATGPAVARCGAENTRCTADFTRTWHDIARCAPDVPRRAPGFPYCGPDFPFCTFSHYLKYAEFQCFQHSPPELQSEKPTPWRLKSPSPAPAPNKPGSTPSLLNAAQFASLTKSKKISRAAFKADYLLALVTLEDGEEPGENDVSELASPPAHSQELGWLSNFPFRLRSEIHGDTEAVSLEKGLAVFRVVANHLR